MLKEGTEAVQTTIRILFDAPGSVSLPPKETQPPGIGGYRQSPEAGVIDRTQKRCSIGSIDGKQETVVDNKFVGGRIPAEDVFRSIEGSKYASCNEFNVCVAIDEPLVPGDNLHL